jgi:hypothetical protein
MEPKAHNLGAAGAVGTGGYEEELAAVFSECFLELGILLVLLAHWVIVP